MCVQHLIENIAKSLKRKIEKVSRGIRGELTCKQIFKQDSWRKRLSVIQANQIVHT